MGEEIAQLRAENDRLKEQLAAENHRIVEREKEIARLREQVRVGREAIESTLGGIDAVICAGTWGRIRDNLHENDFCVRGLRRWLAATAPEHQPPV